MSYTKYTWVTGEVITADKLNHMEDGIAGAFNPAELVVVDGTKYTVKATPETIDSVFAAVGNNKVLYRTASAANDGGAYAMFMGNFNGQTIAANQFVYDETAGGYVYNGGLG